MTVSGAEVPAEYVPAENNINLVDGRILDIRFAKSIAGFLDGLSLTDIKVEKKEVSEAPPLPFNLTKLTTYCSTHFGFDNVNDTGTACLEVVENAVGNRCNVVAGELSHKYVLVRIRRRRQFGCDIRLYCTGNSVQRILILWCTTIERAGILTNRAVLRFHNEFVGLLFL